MSASNAWRELHAENTKSFVDSLNRNRSTADFNSDLQLTNAGTSCVHCNTINYYY